MSNRLFSKSDFEVPSATYRPWTRWWLPGGDIELEELLREVRLFADTMFGGAEIQPFTAGINPQTLDDPSSPLYDYDSPAYYDKLVAVIEEAQQQGIQIDLTMGSGWPPGGPFVPLEDNTDTLVYGEVTVSRSVDMPVPPPIMPFAYAIFSPHSVLGLLQAQKWTRTLTYHPDHAELVAVVAAKITENGRSADPSILTDTLYLDLETTVDITDRVTDGHIQWEPPGNGDWQIIAIYTMPSGSHTLISAVYGERYVVDPFDSDALNRYYNNWMGRHPELLAHAGKTLRALFSDSYEYFAQRFFADDLLETFQANRGYDVTPFLPAVFHPAKDQHFFFFTGLQTAPDFSFGDLSARIIHDYNLTVSDLFFKHWYAVSRQWVEDHDMQFRQQGYNPPLDIIKAAGAATIPETEGGNELWLKRVASGGHLYGRPLITAESFVFLPKGGFALTPQDYKQGIDLLLTAGVNQIIYHGTPYQWNEPGYGEIGWSPFISPYGSNISTNISEADSFWKYQQHINTYAARLQLLLQNGDPDADILVYLPVFDGPDHDRFKPVLHTLNAGGYAWEWVNDDVLLQAEWSESALRAGAMTFQAVVIPDCQAMPVATAEKLASLANEGLPVLVYGQMPSQQPGYLNYLENDKRVAGHLQTVTALDHCSHMTDTDALTAAVTQLPRGVITYDHNPALRFIRRNLSDGEYIFFMRNTTADETNVTLHVDTTFKVAYWLDAQSGNIYDAHLTDATLNAWLAGYGSIALLCCPESIFAEDELSPGNPVQKPDVTESIALANWILQVSGEDVPDGSITISESALGDWSQRDDLKYTSSLGTYTTLITVNQIHEDKRYMLDLGAVHSAADVTVNGQDAGSAIFSPYRVDVTDYLIHGDNRITVRVTPALKNRLLGKALKGDPEYRQFVGNMFGPSSPNPTGLVGPVTLQSVEI